MYFFSIGTNLWKLIALDLCNLNIFTKLSMTGKILNEININNTTLTDKTTIGFCIVKYLWMVILKFYVPAYLQHVHINAIFVLLLPKIKIKSIQLILI